MPIKAIISGSGGSHDATVKAAFLAASGLSSSDVIMSADVPGGKSDWLYASEQGICLIVRSMSDVALQAATILQYYKSHGILTCMAFPDATGAGNAHTEYTGLPKKTIAVTIGAGVPAATQNQTGYGEGLWFWSREAYGTIGLAESSYGNPTGAGAIYTVKAALSCTWWEALMRCVITASTWDKFNGYGQINTAAAIALSFPIPPDLFNGSQTVAADGQSVAFTWTKGSTKTRIVKASTGETIYEGTASSLTWYSTSSGSETFKFYGVDVAGNISGDHSFTQVTLSGLNVFQLSSPANITATVDGAAVGITWDDVPLATHYTVERRRVQDSTWVTVGDTQLSAFEEEAEDLNSYQYRITAYGGTYLPSVGTLINLTPESGPPIDLSMVGSVPVSGQTYGSSAFGSNNSLIKNSYNRR